MSHTRGLCLNILYPPMLALVVSSVFDYLPSFSCHQSLLHQFSLGIDPCDNTKHVIVMCDTLRIQLGHWWHQA